MAGPGIRYHFMAEVLAKDFDVTLGFFDESYLPDNDFQRSYHAKHIHRDHFQAAFDDCDIVIALWLSQAMIDYCNQRQIFMVFDVYAPVPVENLALFLYNGEPVTQATDFAYSQSFNMYDKFFQNGDLFLFSNRRQLDYWMGYVFGTDQIRVSSYQKRPLFERFIYAPMGFDASTPLQHTKPVLRGVIKGISKDDKVLLWTGGIWNWFDAQTLIQAMGLLAEKRPDIKLVFFGTKHPNPNVPAMQEAADSLQLAKKLDLLNKTVFMQEGWVSYNDRVNYLLEADAAVNTTKQTIEAEFAHRTRVLDHFLAGLPTIATQEDYLSDEVIERNDLGLTVPAGDAQALAVAIVSIVEPKTNKKIRQNVANERSNYSWEATLAELRNRLMADLSKLQLAPVRRQKELPRKSRAYHIAKRVTPLFIKKFIIRALRYGS